MRFQFDQLSGNQRYHLITQTITLEILDLYLDENLVTETSSQIFIDNQKLNPLARLGGDDYALWGETVTIKRPS